MKKIILLHNRKVEYDIRKSHRAKRMRLAVYCDGNFVVTIPSGFRETSIERYIFKKSNWVVSKLDYFKKISISKTLKLTSKDFEKNKSKALEIANERVNYFNKLYKFKYNSITIKNQKTRWGSCSKKKNLNFNFKIALLKPEIRDYIVVHELCHLKEFNHSKKFWALVEKMLPNYKNLVKELKINGLQLM